MHIGLIGGIGPAATDFYYRRIISRFAEAKTPLELTIVHADAPTLLDNLARQDVAAQVAIYRQLTDRLAQAGAGCVAVTSIAGHFCIDAFAASSALPIVNLISDVRLALQDRGLKSIGILGTRTVMQSRFYGALPNVNIIAPEGQDLEDVHLAYMTMAAAGVITQTQRDTFLAAAQTMIDRRGAEAIMLGGTDLALAFHEDHAAFRIVDCAAIHADAIVRWAVTKGATRSNG